MRWTKCGCGNKLCKRQQPVGFGTFYQGSGFEPNEVRKMNQAFRKTAWALFSIENNYDQPDNNLVAIWKSKPTIAQLHKVTREIITRGHCHELALTVNGESRVVSPHGTQLRLQRINYGEALS